MAHRMTEILGQPVIVENISGAGGIISSSHVVRAEPDGYTFDFGSRSDAINMTLYKHPTYSLQNDLAPVVLVADQPTVFGRAQGSAGRSAEGLHCLRPEKPEHH